MAWRAMSGRFEVVISKPKNSFSSIWSIFVSSIIGTVRHLKCAFIFSLTRASDLVLIERGLVRLRTFMGPGLNLEKLLEDRAVFTTFCFRVFVKLSWTLIVGVSFEKLESLDTGFEFIEWARGGL